MFLFNKAKNVIMRIGTKIYWIKLLYFNSLKNIQYIKPNFQAGFVIINKGIKPKNKQP